MRIDTDRCTLRSWEQRDVVALPPIANDADVARYLTLQFPHPYTETDARVWISSNNGDQVTNFAIAVHGVLAGGIGLRLGADVYRGSAEVGYWLGRAFWGQGIATAALRAFTEHALSTVPLHRLWAGVMASNQSSMRVLEKSGYIREAVLRSAFTNRAEEIEDCVVFAMPQPPILSVVSPGTGLDSELHTASP